MLARASKMLDKARDRVRGEAKVGVEIVQRAITEPLRQIAANAGLRGFALSSTRCSQ
jgi:chaperonin GroEL (HSP60 family)